MWNSLYHQLQCSFDFIHETTFIHETSRSFSRFNSRTKPENNFFLKSQNLQIPRNFFLSQSLLALKIARPTSRALKMYWLCHYRGPSTKLFCSVISHITLDYGHQPILANVLILYLLKMPEILWFSGVFRGYKMGTLARNGLTFEAPTPQKL